MNTEVTLSFGPFFLIVFTIQQLFVLYAVYRIFFKSDNKRAIQKKVLGALRNRFHRGEIDFDAYKKLERDFTKLEF